MIIIAKQKLLIIIGNAITGISLGLGVWAATMTAPTTVKIIECLSKKDPNQTYAYQCYQWKEYFNLSYKALYCDKT